MLIQYVPILNILTRVDTFQVAIYILTDQNSFHS